MFVVTRDKYLRRQSFDGILCVRLSGEGDFDLGRRPRRGALDWSDRLPERLRGDRRRGPRPRGEPDADDRVRDRDREGRRDPDRDRRRRRRGELSFDRERPRLDASRRPPLGPSAASSSATAGLGLFRASRSFAAIFA